MNGVLDPKFSNEGTTEPVALADVKAPLELDGTYHDTFLNDLITTARQYAEKYLNRSLIPRTITVVIDNCEGGQLLPYGIVKGAITVTDSDGNILDSEIMGTGNFQYLKSPIGGPYTITYASDGYTSETLPKVIKMGIIQAVVYWFENRGDMGTLPTLARNTMRYERVKDNLLFW